MGKVTSEEGWISLGPWGPGDWSRRSQCEASYKADGPVMEITIHYRQLSPVSDTESIDAISFHSKSQNVVVIGCSEIGSSQRTQKVRIDNSVEQLMCITLTVNAFCITSLTFHTNLNKYGPIGPFNEKDSAISSPMDGGVIVGFHGYGEIDCNNRLLAIGVFVDPKIKSSHSNQDPHSWPSRDKKIEEEQKSRIKELEDKEDEFVMKMKEVDAKNEVLRQSNEEMKKAGADLQKIEVESKTKIKELKKEMEDLKKQMEDVAAEKKVLDEESKTKIKELKKEMEDMAAKNEVLRKRNEVMEKKVKIGEGGMPLGPWGGTGGSYWDYMTNGAPVMEIHLKYGPIINSILFISRSSINGDVTGSSNRIGGPGGNHNKKIIINSSDEQLTSISLTYNNFYGQEIITSLCFQSNRYKYGPYGDDKCGHAVSIPIEGVVLAGFHGRVGTSLNAIGIFVAPKAFNS